LLSHVFKSKKLSLFVGILAKKEKGIATFTKIGKLSLIGLIVSLSTAYINTIWAVYIDSFVNSIIFVGIFSSALTALSFLSYFFFIPIIEKYDKGKIYSYSLFFFIISYILFAFNHNFYIFITLAIVITILSTLRVTSFGIMVRDNSKAKEVSSNEGLIYTFVNIAWVIGPLIAGFTAYKFGIGWVFLLSALFLSFGLIAFRATKIKDLKGKKKADSNLFKNFIAFFKNKDRVLAYVLGGGVNFWWSLIYLFIPLMIIRSNLGELWVGYFLFGIAVPLILFGYIFSKWVNTHGFKKTFKIGYFFVSIIAFSCFFVSNIYIILSLLILASIGMAMLESTTEAYFFDILKRKEKYRFYGPYNTAIDTGSFTGKILGSLLLFFLPFKFLFLLFGSFMFLLFLATFKTKNIIESKKK